MSTPIQILVMDDDAAICQYLQRLFSPPQFHTEVASDKASFQDIAKSRYIDVALLDLFLPDTNGIELLKWLKSQHPGVEAIMITGNASVESAIEAMREGAYDYVLKPFQPDELKARVVKAYEKSLLSIENLRLKEKIEQVAPYPGIIGTSNEIKELLKLVDKVAKTDAPVLIHGESGSGKELVAQAIHSNSHRSTKPFVALNCSNLEKQLLESELFGYVPGAFTGAAKSKPGLLACADGGTLFIDEIGDMDLSVQPKLLRALETQEFRRLGDTRSLKVNVRFIAATHKHLQDEIKKGAFREDLFYRLNVVQMEVPPLRKHKEDIPLLVDHFLKDATLRGKASGIQSEALKILLQYDYPGNIRELRNIIERAAILAEGPSIRPQDIPRDIRDRLTGRPTEAQSLDDFVGHEERNFIIKVLKEHGGNKSKAAKALGISRRNLYRKMELYKI